MADPRLTAKNQSKQGNDSSKTVPVSTAVAGPIQLPVVGKFANYECVEFEYSNATAQKPDQKIKTNRIEKIPFDQMPAQIMLAALGCSHKQTDKLSKHPNGKLSQQLAQAKPLEKIEISGFNDPRKKLKINKERILQLAKSASISINADIFPSKAAYTETLGFHQDQEQTFEKASRHPWILLATAICHVQAIDFLVDYETDSKGRALPIARSGEIASDEKPVLLISNPAINFQILQAIEQETGFYLNQADRLKYMRAYFRHQFQKVMGAGCKEFYMLAAGLGAFAPSNMPDSKYPNTSDISKEYFQSLLSVASEFPNLNIIYNPERGLKEFNEVKSQLSNAGYLASNVQLSDQDMNALACAAQKQGKFVALSNASDADVMYATMDVGQNWKSGHCAAEEVLGKLTTCALGSYGFNPEPFSQVEYQSMLEKVGSRSCEPKVNAESSKVKKTLPNVGSFAKYTCTPFTVKTKDILKSKKTSHQIQDIPFELLPAQQILSQLGCQHNENDRLSYYQSPQGDLTSAFQALTAKQEVAAKLNQKLELSITVKPFSDPNGKSEGLTISVSRIQRLHQSSKVYINANIFPSKAVYQMALGKVKPQDPTANKDSLEMWMLLSTSICHAQEIDFYVDYQIQNGNAIAVPREGEIKQLESTILLVSSPSINFRMLQKLEKEDPKALYFLGRDKMKVFMEEFFRNQLQVVKDSGRKTYYMLAAGLGPFLPNEAEMFPGSQIPLQTEIASAYFQALMTIAKEYPELNIVYNPGAFRQQYQTVAAHLNPTNIEMTSQDIYALAVDAQKRGDKVALSNSSDQDSMLGVFDLGQYWKKGDVAGEEVLGKFTSCPLGGYGLNKSPFLNAEFRHAGNIQDNRLEGLKKKQHYLNQKYLYELRRLVENANLWKGETSVLKGKPKVVLAVEKLLNSNVSDAQKIKEINDYVEKREASQKVREGKSKPISSSAKVANKAANEKTRLFMKCILRKNFKEFKKQYNVGVAVFEYSNPVQAFSSVHYSSSASTASAVDSNRAYPIHASSVASSATSPPMTTASTASTVSSSPVMSASSSTSSQEDAKANEKGGVSTPLGVDSKPVHQINFPDSGDDARANILKQLREQHDKIKMVRETVKQMHQANNSETMLSTAAGNLFFPASFENAKENHFDSILKKLKSLNEEIKRKLSSETDKNEVQSWIDQLSKLENNSYALLQSILSGFQFIFENNGDVSGRGGTDRNVFVELYAFRGKAELSMSHYFGVLHELLGQYQKIVSDELNSRLFLLQNLNEETKNALFLDDEKSAENWIGVISELMKTPQDLFKTVKEAFAFITASNGDVSDRSKDTQYQNAFVELYALRENTGQSLSDYVELLNQLTEIFEKKFSESPKNIL